MIVMSEYPSDPRVRRETEALMSNGLHVDIICLQADSEEIYEEVGGANVYRVLRKTEKESFVDYLKLTIRFGIAARRKVNELDKKKNYDLVQVHNMPDYLLFSALRQWFRKPIILDLHDLTPELFESRWGGNKKFFILPLVKFSEYICCKMASAIITTSKGFEGKLLGRGVPKEKVTLVMNSADESFFYFDPSREYQQIHSDVKLFYHGTVAERFGLKTAIKSLVLIKEQIPNPTLHIHGWYDPSYKLELEQVIQELKLTDNVFLDFYIPWEEIRERLVNSDFGIISYLKDDFMDLALSTKGFEYISVGIPIVASKLAPMQSIFSEQSVGYFESGNEVELAEQIIKLCQQPELRSRNVRNARLDYKNVSWPSMSHRYVNLVNSLITKNLPKNVEPELDSDWAEDINIAS